MLNKICELRIERKLVLLAIQVGRF